MQATTPSIPESAPERPWVERNFAALELGLIWLRAELERMIVALHASRLGAADDAAENADHVQAARAAYEAARSALREADEPAQVDRLSQIFALAPFDEDCLLLALAPHVDAGFCALYGDAHDRVQITAPTLHLARALLTSGGADSHRRMLARFSPDAPLRRFALVSLDEVNQAALARFEMDERLARFLLGDDYTDPRLRTCLRPVPAMVCPQKHRASAHALASRLRDSGSRGAVVYGPAQSGRRAVARSVAAELGLDVAELSCGLAGRDWDVQRISLPLLAREAALGGFAVLVDASSATSFDPEQRDRINRDIARLLLATFDGVCFVIAEERLDVAPSVPRVALTALESDDRLTLWREALGPEYMEEQTEQVAEQFRFGPAEIAAIGRHIDSDGSLWNECRLRASRSLEELAERIEPRFTWGDIVLPQTVVHDLHAIAAQVRFQSQVYNRGGFGRKLVRGRGVTALLSGASGVGKTMAAEVIARDLGLDLCRIDLSGVVSKYIGETERHLKTIMQQMELGGAVLMFDECDALFGKRGEINDGRDRYANLEVSYLLQRIETYSGLAILATNLKANIDPAFLRRLRYVIDIPFPDTSMRRAIWQRAFPLETQTECLDFDALARLDITGGNIAVIAVNAAFLAAAAGSPVRMSHITRAAEAEFRKIDKEFRPTWQEQR
jgi:hypothetical protein